MSITLWHSLARQTEHMAQNAFAGIRTAQDWQQVRPDRYREFMQGLGLDPLPPRCDLQLTDHGSFNGQGYRARRISFQILPDCWSAAIIYHPDPLPAERCPAVLYVCGHAAHGAWHYQYHPVMWARRGYVCLIVDTIEQNDNPGEHHHFLMQQGEANLARGYTPAGTEVWNAMRALDVLEADPHVDPARMGATGVSGGGACSFHHAIADPRVRAVSTVAGVSSPVDAIACRHIVGHCDCFYPFNHHARDISEYAALIAPRAILFCFNQHDPLFHPAQTEAVVERTGRIFKLLGKDDCCQRASVPGPHGDHPLLDEATSRWFDRHLAGDERPLLPRDGRVLGESVVSVFNGNGPQPNRLALLPELLTPRASLALPNSPQQWPTIRQQAIDRLLTCVPGLLARPRKTSFALDGDWVWDPQMKNTFRLHRGSIDDMDVWLSLIHHDGASDRLVLGLSAEDESYQHGQARVAVAVDIHAVVYGSLEPRIAARDLAPARPGVSPAGSWLMPWRTTVLRAMALVGQTPIMWTIQDIAVALDYIRTLPEHRNRAIYLHGMGDMAVAALYAAVLDERIAGVILEGLPSSHTESGPILNVLRAMDIPQAVGLLAPRRVVLVGEGHQHWMWATHAYERLGSPAAFCRAADRRQGFQMLLA